jgi:SHS2 domain-containing protein
MSTPSYDYFEHDADIGVVGRAPTIEAAFEQAAQAMFRVMCETHEDRDPSETITIAFRESDPELALVTWLNDLLTAAQVQGVILADFHLERDGDAWRGSARATPWPPGAEPGVEVKGATLTALSVSESTDGWEARCVVDV